MRIGQDERPFLAASGGKRGEQQQGRTMEHASSIAGGIQAAAGPGEASDLRLPQGCTALGHEFRWLHTGAAAFEAMVQMIDAAHRTVEVEFYTVSASEAATRLGAALMRAAARGLTVRVLVDAFGSSWLPPEWNDGLRAAGAELRSFNPRRLLRWSFRNHRKLVVCDDRAAIVGGFNVASEYDGDGIERGWRDFGVRIDGPVAMQLRRGFDALFGAAALRRREVPALARFLRKQRLDREAPCALIGGPGSSRALMRQTLHADLRAARRVDVVAAYFVPSHRIRRLLARVNRRGTVRVLLAGHSDVPVSRWASQSLYPGLLRSGTRLFEYQPQILHAKLLVVDEVVYVGSANLDTRSLQLNFELLVRLPSAVLAEQVRARIDVDCGLSRPVPSDWSSHCSVLDRLMHGAAYFLLTRIDPYLARNEFRHLA